MTPIEKEQRKEAIAAAVDRVFEALSTEFVAKLSALDDEPEGSHIDADRILLECVATFMPSVAIAYEAVEKRCGGWWYA